MKIFVPLTTTSDEEAFLQTFSINSEASVSEFPENLGETHRYYSENIILPARSNPHTCVIPVVYGRTYT